MNKEQLTRFLGLGTLSIVEVMEEIDANAHGILFIVNEKDKLQMEMCVDGLLNRGILR